MRASQVAIILLMVLVSVNASLSVSPNTNLLVDEWGRIRVMHGMNVVYKNEYNANDSLVQEDFENFKKWGITSIRLYMAWEGFEPVRSQYNYTYLTVLRDIVRQAADYGVSVLIDAHHDVYSRKFCGEGLPDWLIEVHNFPKPFKVKLRYDENGYPLKEDCMKLPFAIYYASYDVVQFSHDFFTNKRGMNDKFIEMWARVMEFFRDEDNVIGYDILNQPTGGNLWANPYSLIGPGQTNNRLLLPFYRKLSAALRPIEPKKLFTFQPFPLDMVGGFDGPFSKNYSRLDLLNYHSYCPWGKKYGSQRCRQYHRWYMGRRHSNIHELGVGGILSEFGSVFEEPSDLRELDWVLGEADKHLVSWYYWQYKYNNDSTSTTNPPQLQSMFYPNGTLQEKKARKMTYSHFTALCGRLTSQNHTSSSYTLKYYPERCGEKNTELFLDEEFGLSAGWLVDFKPECEECRLRRREKGYYELVVSQSVIGRLVTVTVGAVISQ